MFVMAFLNLFFIILYYCTKNYEPPYLNPCIDYLKCFLMVFMLHISACFVHVYNTIALLYIFLFGQLLHTGGEVGCIVYGIVKIHATWCELYFVYRVPQFQHV